MITLTSFLDAPSENIWNHLNALRVIDLSLRASDSNQCIPMEVRGIFWNSCRLCIEKLPLCAFMTANFKRKFIKKLLKLLEFMPSLY